MVITGEFKRKVRRAAQEVKETGYEVGFAGIEIDGKIFFGDIVTGGCDYVNPEEGVEALLRNYFLNGGTDARVNGAFHFHPSAEELLIPSYADLTNLCWRVRRNQLIKPSFDWMALGMVERKTIRLLHLTSGTVSEADLLQWVESIKELSCFHFSEERQRKINKGLEEIGFGVGYLIL